MWELTQAQRKAQQDLLVPLLIERGATHETAMRIFDLAVHASCKAMEAASSTTKLANNMAEAIDVVGMAMMMLEARAGKFVEEMQDKVLRDGPNPYKWSNPL